MVALINENQSKFVDVDNDRFSTALTMDSDEDLTDINELNEPFLAVSASNESTTLQLSHSNKSNPRLSTKGILKLMNHCDSIRELSLSYSLLNDELLKALVNDGALHLETLRVQANPESKPMPNVSCETWIAFSNHLPDVNLVLLSYLTETKDYESLLVSYIPLTHLYLGEGTPTAVINRVGERCPRLVELVICSYDGPGTIDEALISAAHGCPRLSALGLGDCELTCSGFIKFVSLCCERLQVLYVLDTSFLEDSEYDISDISAKVSSLLGKSWQPNYVPYW